MSYWLYLSFTMSLFLDRNFCVFCKLLDEFTTNKFQCNESSDFINFCDIKAFLSHSIAFGFCGEMLRWLLNHFISHYISWWWQQPTKADQDIIRTVPGRPETKIIRIIKSVLRHLICDNRHWNCFDFNWS